MSRLKLVTASEQVEDNILFIKNNEESVPVLVYQDNGETYILNKGGSERVEIITCKDLKDILEEYMFKGTKYIASTYNPTLYYLFPGISENDSLFNSENDFIPTLPISDLIRLEIDGFDDSAEIKQGDIRCIKACDSWFNDLEEIEGDINKRIENIFNYYKKFDVTKEVMDTVDYSVDLSKNSFVVSILSDTSYTDTINLEDWIIKSRKGIYPISGKLDISYMYSIGGSMYGGVQTIKAFQYEENVTSKNVIINLGDIQLEYMDKVLKIYPLSKDVDEVVFTDCTLTIGVL